MHQSDIKLQTTIQRGLDAAIATRDANLADGRQGRLLGGNDTEMWFVDSTFVEGVHYALFSSEEAARACSSSSAFASSTVGPSFSGPCFCVYNLAATVSFVTAARLHAALLACHACVFTVFCVSICAFFTRAAAPISTRIHVLAITLSRASPLLQNLIVWKRVFIQGQRLSHWAAAA
jgi:hypothetical protein